MANDAQRSFTQQWLRCGGDLSYAERRQKVLRKGAAQTIRHVMASSPKYLKRIYYGELALAMMHASVRDYEHVQHVSNGIDFGDDGVAVKLVRSGSYNDVVKMFKSDERSLGQVATKSHMRAIVCSLSREEVSVNKLLDERVWKSKKYSAWTKEGSEGACVFCSFFFPVYAKGSDGESELCFKQRAINLVGTNKWVVACYDRTLFDTRDATTSAATTSRKRARSASSDSADTSARSGSSSAATSDGVADATDERAPSKRARCYDMWRAMARKHSVFLWHDANDLWALPARRLSVDMLRQVVDSSGWEDGDTVHIILPVSNNKISVVASMLKTNSCLMLLKNDQE